MNSGFLPSSNCVINLAPDKRAVLQEAYRVLKVMMGLVPVVGAKQGWGVPPVGVPLGCSKWDPAWWRCGMGQGRAPLHRVLSKVALRGAQFSLPLLSCCFLGSSFTPCCLPAWRRDVLQ